MLRLCTKSEKLDTRSWRGIFVGYDKDSLSYFVYFPGTNKVERVRCVKFIDGRAKSKRFRSIHPDPLTSERKPSEIIVEKPEIPNIAEEKLGNQPLTDIELVHDSTNMHVEQQSPEGRYTRARNRPNYFRQDKFDTI